MESRNFRKSVAPIAIAALILAACILPVQSPRACSIPVFRYALEQWRADPYGVIVFHRGPLSESDQALVESLRARALDPKTPANFVVQMVDLAAPLPKPAQDFWEEHGGPGLPWAIVRYPLIAGNQEVVWRGPLTPAAIKSLAESPKRREVARRILAGDSVVWVLLECGDKAKDQAAATSLTSQLSRLQKTLQLPVPEAELRDPTAPNTLASSIPLRISFSVVHLSRSDAAEQMLIAMLMKSEPDLADYAAAPMAFPVYGRGRMPCALVGQGINADNIEEACVFLTGACSCEVKASNPGTDLLMAVGWDGK